MTAHKLRLAEHEGYLCVVWSDYDSNEPVMYDTYYPTGVRLDNYNRELLTAQIIEDDPGIYRVRYHDDAPWLRLMLTEGGATKPVYMDKISVPEPKQRGKRLETRWHWGRWEKYSQREGWIPA